MNTLQRILMAGLLAISMLAGPTAALAGERSSGSSNRHHLIDHQRIQALKEKVADLRERLRERSHGVSGNGNSSSNSMQAQLTDLQTKVTALTASNDSLLTQLQGAINEISLLQGRIRALEANPTGGGGSLASLAQYVTVDPNPINGVKGPHVIFTGVNVHVRSGSGRTDDNGTPSGLGNLILGYNEGPVPSGPVPGGPDFTGAARTGSHNLVGGVQNAFSSVGGFVFGRANWISAQYATVSGGLNNMSAGLSSHVNGGSLNWANGENSLAP